jgi:hypothetical protein
MFFGGGGPLYLGASREHFVLFDCFTGDLIAAWKFMRPTIDIMIVDRFWATYLLRATV